MAIKIYIDQGHNPSNPNAGAEGNGLKEQDVNYNVGVQLADLLNANENFKAWLSRKSVDDSLGSSNAESLAIRANEANSLGADYFISIHSNASDIPTASGTEGYAYSRDSEGFAFGEFILDGISDITGLENRGMFIRPTLYVLRKTQMPAVLIELGYITTPSDAELLGQNPELFAEGIYEGILNYFGY